MGRLQFELDIIKEKNVADYFLIIEDMVRIAREGFNIFVGPGRGSSAGSLICYCLGITKVDPLKHDLLFERFLSPERNVMPDIDIDCEQGSMDIITPIRDKIAISCMLREIHEFSSHAIRHGLYIKNRKRLFCP